MERDRELLLESDVLRTQLTPFPRYDEQDRDFFYTTLSRLGELLAESGRPVLIDATANLRKYRDAARRRIGRFAEVYVDTPLEVCRARDPKGLYRKGLKMTYEPPAAAELVLHGDGASAQESAARLVTYHERRGWLPPAA